MLDFMTLGAIAAKIHATAPAIARQEKRKDRPSLRKTACENTVEAMRHIAAISSGIHAKTFVEYANCPQITHTAAKAVATTVAGAAKPFARSCRSPSVLRAKN